MLLIRLEAKGMDDISIQNLVLTITGGTATNLGTIQVAQGQEIFGLIEDIAGAYSPGFTLTWNVVYPAGFQTPQEDRPSIEFFALFDRNRPDRHGKFYARTDGRRLHAGRGQQRRRRDQRHRHPHRQPAGRPGPGERQRCRVELRHFRQHADVCSR